jgi:hypothetical protein
MRQANKKAILGELRSLAMISAGMIAGSLTGKALDKALKVDSNLPGFQAKKFVRPAVQLGAGVLGAVKLKNQDLKMLSAGVGASGVVSTLKVVLKKDILNGLEGTPSFDTPELMMPLANSVYIEPATESVGTIYSELPSYEPNLPVLANYSEQEVTVSPDSGEDYWVIDTPGTGDDMAEIEII